MLRRRYKKRYILIYDFLSKERDFSKRLSEIFEDIFGKVTFLEGKINFLNLENGFILISCIRGFEEKVFVCLSTMKGILPIRTCGTIKKCRKVMRRWSSKLWDMIEQ